MLLMLRLQPCFGHDLSSGVRCLPTTAITTQGVAGIAIHVVEAILVGRLGELLSPVRVLQMKPDLISKIAAESRFQRGRTVRLSGCTRRELCTISLWHSFRGQTLT